VCACLLVRETCGRLILRYVCVCILIQWTYLTPFDLMQIIFICFYFVCCVQLFGGSGASTCGHTGLMVCFNKCLLICQCVPHSVRVIAVVKCFHCVSFCMS
jgi:hypothetical protein